MVAAVSVGAAGCVEAELLCVGAAGCVGATGYMRAELLGVWELLGLYAWLLLCVGAAG